MKILHTADWHIGKKLHNYELAEDFDRFIAWLKTVMEKEKVEVLLVSGDVFDLANPSSAARSQYYQSLVELKQVVNHIILTGGNHDSPAMLNAPKELMRALKLDVVGGLPDAIEETLIPLKNAEGETELVVSAIPFLRNPDLKNENRVMQTYEDRLAALREGIQEVYHQAALACQKQFPGIPAIAMGHLYAAGVETSESERDIQIGNQAAVTSEAFDPYFKYVALGHIHKPQQVSAHQPVYYSGSPLPLSFSERKDTKRVLLLDTEKDWEIQSIPVPEIRKLIKLKGNIQSLQTKLDQLPPHSGLTHLLEIELIETQYQTKHIEDLENLVSQFELTGYEIVKHRANFEKSLQQTSELFDEHVSLEELQPKKVFEERLNQEEFSEEEKSEIKAAFLELLEELH